MPSILIKDLSASAHKRLREQAKAHHRSMQKEAALLLNGLLAPDPIPDFGEQFMMRDAPSGDQLVRDIKAGRR